MQQDEVKLLAASERMADAETDFSGSEDTDWQKRFQYEPRSTVLKNNLHNITLILQNDPQLQNIVFNQQLDGMEIKGDVPWKHPSKYWRDADDAQLISYVDSHYGTFSQRNYQIAVTKVADDRSYAEDAIYRQISDITISMKSADHLQMPELVSSEYTVQLSEDEREKYTDLKQELVLSLGDTEITAANAASLSGKLSQMANGAIYDDGGEIIRIHDRKLDALEDIIEAANGKPLLVAYWFKHDLIRISERLQKLHIPFSRLDDATSIRRWNNGEFPVALIHPASAGHGLNLQSGGSAIVWFGLTWSLELYQQTIARLWRQGQTSETVVVQHIVTKGTIDERIMKALSQKEHTQTALIDAVKADLKI